MTTNLLKTKRFLPLLITQFLGALNDNLFKNALLTLVAIKMTEQSDLLSNLIAGLFILPFFLFSAIAGEIADKYARDKIARILKITEIILMLGVAVAYYMQNLVLLVMIMTLMGAQSAFFGPIKYALLPQQLKPEELVTGNAYIESTTYMAILFGLILGTLLPIEVTIFLIILLAFCGFFSARQIPLAPAPRPEAKIRKNILKSTIDNFYFLRKHHQIFMSILGASWFWLIGALVAVQVYPLCGKILNTGEGTITFFLVLFSVGVAVGSYFCNRLLKGFIHTTYVPISAVGMGVSLFFLYLFSADYPTPQTRISFAEFLVAPHSFAISLNLFALAFWGGMYIIPLNSFMQSRAPKAYVATVIAGNNIFNALGMVISAIFAIIFLSLGFNLPQLFLAMAILSIPVSVYICALLPDSLTRSLVQALLSVLFKSKVNGISNFKKAGSKVLIISNHVSLLDGVLLAAFMPERITFAINTDWTQKWFMPIIRLLVDFYPIDTHNPLSIRLLIEEVKKGHKVMIFPEGRVTTTGTMMKVYEGAGVVAAKAGAKILPVRINGAQYSKFSYLKNKFPTSWFPKITLDILEPQNFIISKDSMHSSRHQVAHRLYQLMTEIMYKTTEIKANLFEALLFLYKRYGKKHIVAQEFGKVSLTSGELLKQSYCLSWAIKRQYPDKQELKILLPNGIDNLILFFALSFAHKTVEFLPIKTTEKPDIFSIKELKISLWDKIRADAQQLLKEKSLTDSKEIAVILPDKKGEKVKLTHHNLLDACSQLNTVLPLNQNDVVINVLPPYTVMGFNIATLLPLFSGSKIVFYPHTSHIGFIPEICYDAQATVMFGNDEIYASCEKTAHQYDFFSLRYALSDSTLRAETFDFWVKKFGVRILSGWIDDISGSAISINTPLYNRWQTLGNLLPGVIYVNGVLYSKSFALQERKLPKNIFFDEEKYVLTK